MYTLAILQFYVSMSYISKADFKKESKTSGEKKKPQRAPCSAWPHYTAKFLGHAPGEKEEEARVGLAKET